MTVVYPKKWIRQFSSILAIIIVICIFFFYFSHQDIKKYDDVLNSEAKNVSQMPLTLTAVNGKTNTKEESSSVGQKQQQSDENNKDTKRQQDTKQTNTSKSNQQKIQGKKKNNKQSTKEQEKSSTTQQRTEHGTGDNKNNSAGKRGDSKEIIAGEEDTNPYFTTSIQDGETVSKSKYHFTITQKNPKKKVLQTEVIVNGVTKEDFSGQVRLKQGKNKIKIQVTYDDSKNSNVERNYTVYYEENKLIIHTDLKETKTSNRTIQFYANAYFNEEQFDAHVKLDGEALVKNTEGKYVASLKTGLNNFIITAKRNGEHAKKIITVQYEKKKARIHFETDLKNQQTTSAELSFYAKASKDGKNISMKATLNGERMEEKNNIYFDLLKEGKNIVVLSASADGSVEKETYTVYYTEPGDTSQTTVPDDKNGPTIETDLKNGTQVYGSIKNIIVRASDINGKRIQANGVSVKVNGQGIGFIWDDSEKTSYKLKLREGKNTVVIKAWDEEGRITTKTYTVYAKNVDEGKKIGHATISVEATTVGLGYLIKPTTVEIHEGEKGSYVLDQLLRKYRFSYTNTGTLDSNFYLAGISKVGMSTKLKVPQDLAELVKKSSSFYDETSFDENSLGEFDIANGSGWMYSINGEYPNYGFSDAYFLDGDIIRIRYTLHYGSDINGAGATGNNLNSATGGNGNGWGKEW